MSKVICDICGTAYPETATQCPICGCARDNVTQTPAADATQKTDGEAAAGYTYVKGGRFSKRNVRRRNQKDKPVERRTAASRPRPSAGASAKQVSSKRPARNQQKEEATNRGLVALVFVLLLAIIAVVIYIFVRVFGPGVENPKPGNDGTQHSTVQTNLNGTEDSGTGDSVPCTALELSNLTIEFTASGAQTKQLTVNPVPANTTDVVEFYSSDESIVTVSATGEITAVGSGEAVITVKCGEVTAQCMIYSNIGGENPSIPAPEFVFEFNTAYTDETTGFYDATLKVGNTWKAYKSSLSVDVSEITWISDDPTICTIENGIVQAVSTGITKIYAVYDGVTFTCIVRVK